MYFLRYFYICLEAKNRIKSKKRERKRDEKYTQKSKVLTLTKINSTIYKHTLYNSLSLSLFIQSHFSADVKNREAKKEKWRIT